MVACRLRKIVCGSLKVICNKAREQQVVLKISTQSQLKRSPGVHLLHAGAPENHVQRKCTLTTELDHHPRARHLQIRECGMLHLVTSVGETGRNLRDRFGQHIRSKYTVARCPLRKGYARNVCICDLHKMILSSFFKGFFYYFYIIILT